jgi:NAD(P)H-flavin reductase/hemoglobin-like flavoprotein
MIDPRLIKLSLEALAPKADRVVGYFYAVLFTVDPSLRDLFPAAMDLQRDRLFQALLQIGQDIENPVALTAYLQQLGRDHRKYGVRDEHYPAVGAALLAALASYAGDLWTAELAESWTEAYQFAAQIMIEAAQSQAASEPPYWSGQVIRHQRHGSDIAVLTIQPDQPLPYRSGQYLSVETTRWPRVWRTYSIANAPRSDHALEIHVRAVPAGWVSNALVHHTRPGDLLRLGPALGSMVLDPASNRPLVLIGGGTGIAPIKALVQQLARTPFARTTRVFFGVRKIEDLYDLSPLTRISLTQPWLTIAPVVSDDPNYPGLCGPVVQTADDLTTWHGHEVYLCGPPPMVRSGLAVLEKAGVPSHDVHFDPFPAQ